MVFILLLWAMEQVLPLTLHMKRSVLDRLVIMSWCWLSINPRKYHLLHYLKCFLNRIIRHKECAKGMTKAHSIGRVFIFLIPISHDEAKNLLTLVWIQ
ncbi:UNVERIFIED_CONTAM: hypothetical protein GTU68_023465 [Idotea baltica]|nr:hypothetical protein [Idotea baltica]